MGHLNGGCPTSHANDTPVIMADDNIPMLEWKVNNVLEALTCWILSAGLSLATMKAEVVLFTCHCIQSPLLPKGGGDQALYSPKVLEAVVRRKADFQGACQTDSSQN